MEERVGSVVGFGEGVGKEVRLGGKLGDVILLIHIPPVLTTAARYCPLLLDVIDSQHPLFVQKEPPTQGHIGAGDGAHVVP